MLGGSGDFETPRKTFVNHVSGEESMTTLVTTLQFKPRHHFVLWTEKTPQALQNFTTQDGSEGTIWSYQANR